MPEQHLKRAVELKGTTESISVDIASVRGALEAVATEACELAQISCFLARGNLVFSWFFLRGAQKAVTAIRCHQRVPASGEWMGVASARDLWPRAEAMEAEISELFGIEWRIDGATPIRTTEQLVVGGQVEFPMRTQTGRV